MASVAALRLEMSLRVEFVGAAIPTVATARAAVSVLKKCIVSMSFEKYSRGNSWFLKERCGM